MNHPRCDYEPALVQALRDSALTDPLRSHVVTCPACQQTHRLTTLLRDYAGTLAISAPPSPPAAVIWQRAEQQRAALALRRASVAMLAMRLLAALYVLCLSLWSLRALWVAQPAVARNALRALTTGTIPLAAGSALALLLLGTSALLLVSQRSGPSQPSLR